LGRARNWRLCSSWVGGRLRLAVVQVSKPLFIRFSNAGEPFNGVRVTGRNVDTIVHIFTTPGYIFTEPRRTRCDLSNLAIIRFYWTAEAI